MSDIPHRNRQVLNNKNYLLSIIRKQFIAGNIKKPIMLTFPCKRFVTNKA